MAHGLSLSLARTAQKAPRRAAGCFLILLCKQAANQARRHTDAVQQRHDKQILFGVFVGAQQHRQPHACAKRAEYYVCGREFRGIHAKNLC